MMFYFIMLKIRTHGVGATPEGRIAAELLDAYESGTNDNLKAVISKQVFTFLDGPVFGCYYCC